MSDRAYLEVWAWKIGDGGYDDPTIQDLHERIDVERAIQRAHERREALYMELNGIKPGLADYWRLPEAQRKQVRMEIGKR
jgi:hypothetical protein